MISILLIFCSYTSGLIPSGVVHRLYQDDATQSFDYSKYINQDYDEFFQESKKDIIQIIPNSKENQLPQNRLYYDKKYAVIIVGYYNDKQHYQWFTNDAQRQYTLLNEKYGFNKSNIFVLLTLKEEWSDVLRIDPNLITYNATEENISLLFSSLQEIIDDNDLLYIVVISHGGDTHHYYFQRIGIDFDVWQGIVSHDTFFALENTSQKNNQIIIDKLSNRKYIHYNQTNYDNRVYDYELKEYTNEINARRIIYILQPCFSGGFVNDLSDKNNVVITASTEAQPAFASFIGYFSNGLNGSAPDQNQDDRVSLGEIYEYTVDEVLAWIKENPDGNMGRNQYPLIDDDGNKIGHRYQGTPSNEITTKSLSVLFNNHKARWFFIFVLLVLCFILAVVLIKNSIYDPTNKFKDGYVAARIYDLSYEEIE